jgi:hypothetical protein
MDNVHNFDSYTTETRFQNSYIMYVSEQVYSAVHTGLRNRPFNLYI